MQIQVTPQIVARSSHIQHSNNYLKLFWKKIGAAQKKIPWSWPKETCISVGKQCLLTGFPNLDRMSCGHIDGVSALNGPPGVGVNSDDAEVKLGVADMLTPSPGTMMTSSSSSDSVSATD